MRDEEKIETGRLRLAQKTRPALDPGTYTVKAEQRLSGDTRLSQSTVKPAFYSFSCEADSFALPADLLYSVYPPRDSFGEFELVIPHLVLKRRTLPWERKIREDAGKTQLTEAPWLALLLFGEGEAATLITDSKNHQAPKNCYTFFGSGEQPNMVLEIDAALFRRVCPKAEDLPLMAHARCVSRDDKTTEAEPLDNWLSVLTANRLPRSSSRKEGFKNTVYLVSMEQLGDFLADAKLFQEITDGRKYQTIRIPVLASWNFYSKCEEFSFRRVFENLSASALCPSNMIEPRMQISQRTKGLLDRGYVALNHRLRDGSKTVSLYHGPFRPWEPEADGEPYQLFSDAGLIYDPELGCFDISVSMAFNLGRMLALRNGSFRSALARYRDNNKRKAAKQLNRHRLAAAALGIDAAARENRLLCQDFGNLKSAMNDKIAAILLDAGIETPNETAEYESVPGKSWMMPLQDLSDIPSLYSRILSEQVRADCENSDIPQEIMGTLSRFSLLYDIPYEYLIPNRKLLPPESVRFFHMDHDWLNALLDGALSLGRLYEVDYEHDTALIEKILHTVYLKSLAIRPALQGKSAEEINEVVQKGRRGLLKNQTGTDEKEICSFTSTGFLLRSKMVSGWRGLEFRAYADAKKQTPPLVPLRIETLGPEILLAIFAGDCCCLEIGQPPEGMHFGFEKRDGVYQKLLRRLDTGAVYETEKVYAEVIMRDKEAGILDWMETAKQISRQLLPGQTVTSAHMALQMVQNPAEGQILKV